jgi:hypothetical protein
MCNQTEMYKEMAEYDRQANRGLKHIRGIAHNPSSCPKCLKDAGKLTKSKREEILRDRMGAMLGVEW